MFFKRVNITFFIILICLCFPVIASNSESWSEHFKNEEWFKIYEKGLVYLEQGEYEKAVECFEKSIELNPVNNSHSWYKKGVAFYKLGRPVEDELACYNKALEIFPGHGKANYAKGWILFDRGDTEEAIKLYRIALFTDPDSGFVWYGGPNNSPDVPEKILYPIVTGNTEELNKILDSDPDLISEEFGFDDPRAYKQNLLIFAVKYNQKEIINILLSRGMDINIGDMQYMTPLHWAVIEENEDIIEFLISKGSDINALTFDRMTPLDLARSDEIKKILIKYGALSASEL